MSLVNASPFAVQDATFVDELGREVASVIVKGTFVFEPSGRATLADDPSPVRTADELLDPDQGWSSAKYPSDMSWGKVGTDVVIVGEATAPKPTRAVDVVVTIADRSVPLRVHGERLFFKGAAGIGIGPAAMFERMPIVWERAFGGVSPDLTVMENRNPSGLGVASKAGDLEGTPAPQIEHPAHPVRGPNDKAAPAGYGPILPFWSPRREQMGTLDERWRTERMPLLPVDFDLRFHNVAHPSLVFPEGLAPGQRVATAGMSLAPFLFDLPRLGVVVHARFDGSGKRRVTPPIDTVLIEPSERRVEITARATFPVGRGRDVLRELRVDVDDG